MSKYIAQIGFAAEFWSLVSFNVNFGSYKIQIFSFMSYMCDLGGVDHNYRNKG